MDNDMVQPRLGDVSIAGHPWLARMLDKSRLEAQGVLAQLDLAYPCPMDQRLLGQLGISAHDFQEIAVKNQTDEAVVEALKAVGVKV